MVTTDTLDGGFADPVFAAQGVFRAVMDAMARPGSIRQLPALAAPPAPLTPAGAAVALTLCDHETAIWLDPALQATRGAVAWLGFHAGAPLARTPSDAQFAIVSATGDCIALENFAQGTQEYPDRSATLILQVDTLSGGQPLVLKGPGIATEAIISPAPLPRHFVEQWRQNGARFPRGVDVVLAAPEGIACLPRTTRIEPKEG